MTKWALVNLIIGALFPPTLANAGEMRCELPLVAGAGRNREAVLNIAYDSWDEGARATVTMEGTHRDPDWVVREKPETRSFEARIIGEATLTLTDGNTSGLFAIDYGRKAGLSLHIAGRDRMYFEQFIGFCERSS